jgi:hypothetical protein
VEAMALVLENAVPNSPVFKITSERLDTGFQDLILIKSRISFIKNNNCNDSEYEEK